MPARQRPINLSGLVAGEANAARIRARAGENLSNKVFLGLRGAAQQMEADRRLKIREDEFNKEFGLRERALSLRENQFAEDQFAKQAGDEQALQSLEEASTALRILTNPSGGGAAGTAAVDTVQDAIGSAVGQLGGGQRAVAGVKARENRAAQRGL